MKVSQLALAAAISAMLTCSAFAQGDEATLRGLLETPVFESFSGAIRARNGAGEVCANTLEGIDKAEIVEAELTGSSQAKVTVRFVSDQISFTRDKEGHPVAGTDAVTEICVTLDGLPLGIELAASRMAAMSAIEVRDRLADRFRLLQGTTPAPERHLSLGHAVEWSYDLLTDDEQHSNSLAVRRSR